MAKSTFSPPTPGDPTRLGRRFKKRLRSGEMLISGAVIEYLRPSLVKVYRYAGFDFIFLENEHSLFQGSELADFVLAARDNGLPVVAKTAQVERAELTRMMEAGISGIQLARTESREELTAMIDVMKYPPMGTRAGAPCYGHVDYITPTDVSRWFKKVNASVSILAQIESAKGYENAEEIISTPHLDMLFVGPFDFSISLGYPGEYDHPVVRKAMREILDLCLKYKVPFGTIASGPKAAQKWMDAGCQWFVVFDEISMVYKSATDTVASYHRGKR